MSSPIFKNLAKMFTPKPKAKPKWTLDTFKQKVDSVASSERENMMKRKAELEGEVAKLKAQIKGYESELAALKPWLEVV